MPKETPKKTAWYSAQWGTPTYDDNRLFELLTVGTFQAGLSWKVVVGKRPIFLRNFANFDPKIVAGFMPDDLERIINDSEMIRNPRKIEATINNAQAIIKIQKEFGSFSNFLWDFVGNSPLQFEYVEAGDVPNQSILSAKLAKELKKRGFKFVGPIITYMFMKASGLVQDVVLE